MFWYKRLKQDIIFICDFLDKFQKGYNENISITNTNMQSIIDWNSATHLGLTGIVNTQESVLEKLETMTKSEQDIKDSIKAKAYESLAKMEQNSNKEAIKAMIESITR